MFRAHNFSAGPAVLPLEVVEQTSKAALDYNGLGMSIMEMSHRSKEFEAVIKEAQADCLKLMELSNQDYSVLFLGGGASMQFAMVAMNFMHKKVDYVNTGVWATKAYKEAKIIATEGIEVNEIASSSDKNFNYIPQNIAYSKDADYCHITTNNTIYGTEWRELPNTGSVPLIVDMSSDLFAQRYDFSKCSLIYAGAQKNIGPSGVTLVVIKNSFMETANSKLPTMLKYVTHAKEDSMFNTPPCLPIFVVNRTFKWIMKQGGIDAIQSNNIIKANYIYDKIDSRNDFYKGSVVNPKDRSLMNITFNLPSEDLENKFINEAKALNMIGLKGHRLVGGVRASTYNALPNESAISLSEFMEQFYQNNK